MAGRRRILLGGLVVAACLAAVLAWQDPFEIHVLGGSTAYGEPYGPDLNAAAIAGYLLGGEVKGRPITVVNHARRGGTSHQVLATVADVPDDAGLVFLYSGHNEFLNIDEPGDLSKLERRFIDRDPLTPEKRGRILERYEDNIEAILDELGRRGVPVLISTVTSNVADFDPNRSVLSDPQHRVQVEALAARAWASEDGGQQPGALQAWREVIALEPRFAWAHFELANLLRAEGRFDDAAEHYARASDFDALPYRGTRSQNGALRRIAKERGVALLDTAAAFEQASAQGLVGYDLMWDNCHPTLEGYTIIARGIAREVARRHDLPPPDVDESAAAIGRFFQLDDDARFDVLHSRGRFLYSFATLVWAPEKRLLRSRRYLDQAVEIKTNAHVLSSLAVVGALLGSPEESAAFWRRALALDARRTRKRWSDPRVQEIMQRSPALRAEAKRLRGEIETSGWLSWLPWDG